MKMFKKAIVFSLITVLFVSTSLVRAGTVLGTGGATEFTQVWNYFQLVKQVAQQAQAYATQLDQYRNMLTNTENIPQQAWNDIVKDLTAVARIVQQGQALAYSAKNIGMQFQNTFKGFQFPAGFNYKAEYTKWSTTTMDSLKGALEAAGFQSQQFASEENVLHTLRGMSSNAKGQMQAIQVGIQIAEQQVQQLQKLRQLVMLQIQSQNTYLAAQQNKEDTINAAKEDAFTYQSPVRSYTQFKGGSQ